MEITTYQPLGTSQNEIFRPPEYEIGQVHSYCPNERLLLELRSAYRKNGLWSYCPDSVKSSPRLQ